MARSDQGLVAALQSDCMEPFNSQSVERIRQEVGLFCLFIITIAQLWNLSFRGNVERWLGEVSVNHEQGAFQRQK